MKCCNYSGCVLPATSRSPATTMYVVICGIGKNIHNCAGNTALKVAPFDYLVHTSLQIDGESYT